MNGIRALCTALMALCCVAGFGQSLSPHWEDLTSEDFIKALDQAKHVCVLPFGILEKHGPSGPLGTDLINVRGAVLEGVQSEYAIVFPEYFAGQISEARHQPGTVAYPAHLQLEMLQATVDEMSRNGCHKILIVNGHGGNTALLGYFAQMQLDKPRDYVIYTTFAAGAGPGVDIPAAARPSGPGVDGHAGESEIAGIMANRPQAAHPERAGEESGATNTRLKLPEGMSTPIWWYALYPNHYQGDAAKATAARGEALRQLMAATVAADIRFVKQDQETERLQNEFFDAAEHPVQTKQ